MALETVFQNTRASSLNKFNLIENELLHRSGLIARADRHARRIEYLSKNMKKLQKRLGPKHQISGYGLEGMVVTKTVPLISSVGDMRFVNVFDFLETLSGRSHSHGTTN